MSQLTEERQGSDLRGPRGSLGVPAMSRAGWVSLGWKVLWLHPASVKAVLPELGPWPAPPYPALSMLFGPPPSRSLGSKLDPPF